MLFDSGYGKTVSLTNGLEPAVPCWCFTIIRKKHIAIPVLIMSNRVITTSNDNAS
jgi:hypothetical protein